MSQKILSSLLSILVIFSFVLTPARASAQIREGTPTGNPVTSFPKDRTNGVDNIGAATVSSVTPSMIQPGTAVDLCFTVTIPANDAEYLDRFDFNLPDSWTVNSVTDVPETGCGDGSGYGYHTYGVDAGNIVNWTTSGYPPNTLCGAWGDGQSYNFCANITVPDCSGTPWSIPWNIIGDGYGSPPHSVSGDGNLTCSNGPDIEITPLSLNAEQCPDSQTSQAMEICNMGRSPLDWELSELAPGGLNGAAMLPLRQYAAARSDQANAFPETTAANHILGNRVLIFQNYVPWSASIQAILNSNGIAYDQVGSGSMASIDLSLYELVIVVGAQDSGFYAAWNASLPRFEAYLSDGGALWLSAVTVGSGNLPSLPGGVVLTNDIFNDYNNVAAPGHPWVAGVSSPFYGSYASHGELSNLYPGTIIVTTAAASGNPTLVDYPFGAGRVLITTQPLEYNWAYGQGGAAILQNSLIDLLAWEPGIPWLSEDPITGTLAAGGCTVITVTFNSTGLTPGDYLGNLYVTSTDLDEPTITIPVTMTVLAPAEITGVTYTINDLEVMFDATAGGQQPLSYDWDFGDGGTANIEDPTHTYALGGTYSSTLNVSNVCGSDSWLDSITVCEPIHNAEFTWSPINPLLNQTALFTATAEGTAPFNFTWDFGDGGTGTGPYADHAYAVAGTYTVTVMASNSCGQDVVVHTIEVAVPDIEVSPLFLNAEQCPDAQTSQALQICNVGNAPLAWELGENPSGSTLGAAIIPPLRTAPALTNNGAAFPKLKPETKILGNQVLIVEDDLPWYRWSTPNILTANGIGYDMAGSADMAAIDLSPYVLVIVASAQSGAFYNAWNANFAKFDAYVSTGGSLWMGTATSTAGLTNPLLPGGVVLNDDIYAQYGNVAAPTHPWVAGVSSPFDGLWLSHGEFSNLYSGSIVVATSATTGNPTLVDYQYGLGRVLITSLTLEIGWEYGWGEAPILQNSLLNMYSPEADIPWLDETPTAGSLAAGECASVDVTFDSTGQTPGDYFANLLITSDDLDEPTITIPVTMTVLAPADITGVTHTINNLEVMFDATVTGEPPITYDWTFGDGGTANIEDPTHTYALGGTYTSTLNVSNICGTDSWHNSINVCDPVHNADFTWSPAGPLLNQTVSFTATVEGTAPFNFTWDFGDGSTGTGPVADHAYSATGTYTVTLMAANSCGQDAAVHTITVVLPDIEITAPPLDAELCPGATDLTTFTICNVGTAPLDWSLSELPDASWLNENPTAGALQPDGCVDVEVSFDSTGQAPGSYTADLVLNSGDPDEPEITLPVTLTVFSPADITNVTYTTVDLQVEFDATASGEAPLAFAWAFGDGGTSNIEDPTHAYSSGGTYQVSLDVSNLCGTDSWTGEVSICNPVSGAEFTWTPLDPIINESVSFTGTVIAGDPPFTYTWDWGDGSTGSGQYASHAYSVPGSYQVTLTVTNSCGQSTVSHQLIVAGIPAIDVDPLTVEATLLPDQIGTAVFTITNSGSANLEFNLVEAAPWLVLNPATATLLPGESIAIIATFDSSGLSPSTYTYDLWVYSNDPTSPVITMQAILTVIAPEIDIDPGTVAMTLGMTETGTTTMTISNMGSADLHVISIDNLPSWLSVAFAPLTIGPGGSESITFTFNSSGLSTGVYTGTISIHSDDWNDPVLYVTVSLTVTPPPITYYYLPFFMHEREQPMPKPER